MCIYPMNEHCYKSLRPLTRIVLTFMILLIDRGLLELHAKPRYRFPYVIIVTAPARVAGQPRVAHRRRWLGCMKTWRHGRPHHLFKSITNKTSVPFHHHLHDRERSPRWQFGWPNSGVTTSNLQAVISGDSGFPKILP